MTHETEKIWNIQPDILSQQLRNLCTFPRVNHRFPFDNTEKLNQPEATHPPELQLGAIVKHKYLAFPPGEVCKIRWFPCIKQVSSLPGIYIYFVDTFPQRFSVSINDIEECNP